LDFSTFNRKFFWILKFHGQKKSGFPDAMTCVPENGLRRWCQSVAKLTTFFPTFAPTFFSFFNFRPENFLGFSNFEPKKFGRKNFRAKKNPAHKLSNQKFLSEKNFRPYERDVIGRIHFEWPAPPSS